MTTIQQKDRELKQLDQAFTLLGITNYKILEKDKESPDFIVRMDSQDIGVEVTEHYRDLGDAKSAKTQSDLPKIVKEAIEKYNQKEGEPMAFGFAFNGNIAVKNRKSIACELGQFLYEHYEHSKPLPNQSSKVDSIIPDKIKYPSLRIIHSICAKRIDDTNAVGFITSVFDSIQVEQSALESRIQEKAVLLSKYRQRCDIIWLLITLPSMMLAGDLLPDKKFTNQYKDFDAIYVLDEYQARIQRLK